MTPQEDYCTIPLNHGLVAIIDPEDFEYFSHFKWRAQWCVNTRSWYATRSIPLGPYRQYTSMMHREVLGLPRHDPRIGDHIRSGETLDNRRSNLRIATQAQNTRNSRKRKTNTTGFKGVSFHKHVGKFSAHIHHDGRTRFLGYRDTAAEAHKLYCAAAAELHGAFAHF